jgi:hypothetical protein
LAGEARRRASLILEGNAHGATRDGNQATTCSRRRPDLIEYGLLVALIAIVAIVGVTTLGNTISNVFWTQIGAAI